MIMPPKDKRIQPFLEQINALKASVFDKNIIIDHQDLAIKNKDQMIANLKEALRLAQHQRFAASSEKLNTDQQSFVFDEAEGIADIAPTPETLEVASHQRKKKRTAISDDLPRVEVIHDLDEVEKVCPKDGTALKHIGDECSEQVDYIPAKITILRHRRLKYACPCCKQFIVTAKKPPQPIEKSIASPSLLAQIATHKYCDGLPLYRQVPLFKRAGITLDRTSLANWMIKCGQLIQPLINLIQEHITRSAVVCMDETVLQVLTESTRRAQQDSRMWVMTNYQSDHKAVVFAYSETRAACHADALLGDFNNALMTDGYAVYESLAKKNSFTSLGCWAHARRYFKEAKESQPKGSKTSKVDMALSLIQKLYLIEKAAKTKSNTDRYHDRQQLSLPAVKKLRQWLDKTLQHPVNSAKLTKALTYLNNQWPKLIGYLDDGAYPIDNNTAENAIRPFVIGRKNWLFAATPKGATASANLYSLVETAKANNLSPSDYLQNVFTQLPAAQNIDDIEALLPWNVKDVVR